MAESATVSGDGCRAASGADTVGKQWAHCCARVEWVDCEECEELSVVDAAWVEESDGETDGGK